MYFVVAGTFFILPLYLQTVLGLDALQSGIRILPMSIAIFVLAILGSRNRRLHCASLFIKHPCTEV